MFIQEIIVSGSLKLVRPEDERDGQAGYDWLMSQEGNPTMHLMGNANFTTTTLEAERARVHDFLISEKSLNWSIQLGDHVVGAVWIDLKEPLNKRVGWLSIMIGDSAARGQGVGHATSQAVINWAFMEGNFEKLFARHIVENQRSKHLLTSLGFIIENEVYEEADNMWQNYYLTKSIWLRQSPGEKA